MCTCIVTYVTEKILPEWLAEDLYGKCPVVDEEDGVKTIKTLNGLVRVRVASKKSERAFAENMMNE